MYEIIFYQDSKGYSDLLNYIEELNEKSLSSKNERIILKQIRFYINILELTGFCLTRTFASFISRTNIRYQ